MDQTLDPLLQLDEGAVGHHVDDLAADPRADRVLVGHVLPRTGGLLLQPQRDLLALLVDVQDHHLDLVVDLEHVAGVVDPSPAHVGDVQEAVDAAKVHERAEVGDVLDGPLADLALGDLLHERLFLLLAGDLDQFAATDDDVVAGLVDLQDDAVDVLVDEVGDVRRPADVDLAGRQEDVDADVDQEAPLDLAGDLAGDHVVFVVLGDHLLPGPLAMGLAAGDDDLAGLVLHSLEQDLDLVAGLGRRFVLPLVEGDEALGLVADVDDHLVADQLDHLARDDAADLEALAFAEEVVEVLGVLAGGDHRGQFVLVDVEFAKEVAIYHKSRFVKGLPPRAVPTAGADSSTRDAPTTPWADGPARDARRKPKNENRPAPRGTDAP